MKRALLISAAAMSFAVVAPANAATIFYCGFNAPSGSSCVSDTDNVILTNATGVGNPGNPVVGIGTVNGTEVQFTTTETAGLDLVASGQARVLASDGILNNLTWQLINAAFAVAEFNLIDLNNDNFNVTIDALGAGGVATSTTYLATRNGSNRFGVLAGAGEILTGVTIDSADGFGSFRQLRIDGIGAVPEPATWAMMLLGFGILGVGMRRKSQTVRGRINFA